MSTPSPQSKQAQGNIGIAHAISYFAAHHYYIYLPMGNHEGAIDLVVSKDGNQVQRVQCKYTGVIYKYSKKTTRTYTITKLNMMYDAESFDLLFVVTPAADYLIDWKEYCQRNPTIARNLRLWSSFDKYKV